MFTYSIMKCSTCMANLMFLAFCTCCEVNYSFCETVGITFEYMSFPCVGRGDWFWREHMDIYRAWFVAFLHPPKSLFGWSLEFILDGNLAWHSIFWKFCGCLKTTIGGCSNVFDSFMSLVIVVKCLAMIFEILGSFGWNVTVNMTLLFLSVTTLTIACSRVIVNF